MNVNHKQLSMIDTFQHAIGKFHNLKFIEKKFFLCSFIGLIDIETLSSLNVALRPINPTIFPKTIPIPVIENANETETCDLKIISENFVADILSFAVKIIQDDFIASNSFDKYILNEDSGKLTDTVNLPPIAHEHTIRLQTNCRLLSKMKNSKKHLFKTPNHAMLLIKHLSTDFLTNKDKFKFLSEIICSEDCKIQLHISQCINRRLNDTWSISTMPATILRKIFQHFSAEDLMNVSLVNKRWHFVSHENNLWKEICSKFGHDIGFSKISNVIVENLGEDESRINWFEIYKTIKRIFKRRNSNSPDIRDLKTQKIQFYNDIKSVRIKPKMFRMSTKRSISEASTRRQSRNSLKINNLSFDPENDSRQLMKPIIGRLKQFQKSEEVAIDCKPSNLISNTDKMNQLESKFNLKWSDTAEEANKSTTPADLKQLKKLVPIKTCFKLTGHLDSVTSVKFDKLRMFSSSSDGSLRIWDSITGRSIRKLYGHKGSVHCLDFSGQILVSGGWDTTVIVWSVECNFSMIKMLYGHMGSITSVKIVKTRELIISASLDGTLRFHSTKTLSFVNEIVIRGTDDKPIGILDMQIEDTRSLIATGQCDKSIKIISMDNTECIYNLGFQKDVMNRLYFQSQLLISGGSSGYLHFWHAQIPNQKVSLKAQIQIMNEKQVPLSVECIFYHSKSLWTGHNDGSIKEWHIGSMTCMRTLYGHKGAINSIYCFDNRLASASVDGSIRMWEMGCSEKREIPENKNQSFKERVPISCIFK